MQRLSIFGLSTAVGLPLALLAGCWACVLLPNGNPLEEHDVHIEWKDAGSTPSYPWIEVYFEDDQQRIDCPLHFGGIEYPKLSFKDIDADGVPEIHFYDSKFEQIVGFKPTADGSPPRWIIHKNETSG
jgi:hypothetical protein